MLVYGVYGDYAPELISHAGDSFPNLCVSIFYKSDGVFGIMANVLATYIILFVIFGAFLEKCGAQRFFIDFPLAAANAGEVGCQVGIDTAAQGLDGFKRLVVGKIIGSTGAARDRQEPRCIRFQALGRVHQSVKRLLSPWGEEFKGDFDGRGVLRGRPGTVRKRGHRSFLCDIMIYLYKQIFMSLSS